MKQAITLAIILILLQQMTFAQTGPWNLAGNSLTGTEKLGSTNSKPLNFITNKKTRMTLTANGNLSFTSDTSSIQFPVPGSHPNSMIFMFPSGTTNPTRMVIAHSPAVPNFGLQYDDFNDKFDFLSGGKSIVDINLSNSRVGINNSLPAFPLDVAGNTRFVGNVGIQGIPTNIKLHIDNGASGTTPLSSSTIATESTGDNFLSLLTPSGSKSALIFGNSVNNQDGAIVFNNPVTPHGMQFNTNSFTRMTLTGSGKLGVGTFSPDAELHLTHPLGSDSHHGLKIENLGPNHRTWTLYTSDNDGALELYAKTQFKGFFESTTGEYFNGSDIRLKKDIETAPDVLQKVMQLDIKKYHFNENKSSDKKHYGMIAQEVEGIFPEVVLHKTADSSTNDVYMMNYSAFGVIALKAIQELQKQNEAKEDKIDVLQQQNNELEKRIQKLETILNVHAANSTPLSGNISVTATSLEQNTPNPFAGSTTIRYTLPNQFSSAQIIVTDQSGIVIKKINLSNANKGVVNIDAATLTSGIYTYALIVDGKVVASKRMEHLK